jgi:hypothetical protein
MPRCIYCMLDKPEYAFDPEHVFSRGYVAQALIGRCRRKFAEIPHSPDRGLAFNSPAR